ncbi:PfkB family carbohydrate kinase [Microbacterium ginsengiterrae]|nr:PfkB family carbohydrate kinase [Microbacterium ginsengiterrae]
MTMAEVTVVGDGIVDIISRGDADGTRHAGGSALNVATGLTILGRTTGLIYQSGADEPGEWLVEYLEQSGVRPIRLLDDRGTGTAHAYFRTADGEPTYSFNEALLNREYVFDSTASQAIRQAKAVVVSGFPLDHEQSVDAYLQELDRSDGLGVIDPNPRPAILNDVEKYRIGFERVARGSRIVKLSDEDLITLYGDDQLVAALVDSGIVVVVTHGRRGASVHLPGQPPLHAPARELAQPMVDTLGAGDATLAALIAGVLDSASLTDRTIWEYSLARAMEIAAWTCRSAGGTLQLPKNELSEPHLERKS